MYPSGLLRSASGERGQAPFSASVFSAKLFALRDLTSGSIFGTSRGCSLSVRAYFAGHHTPEENEATLLIWERK